MLCILHINSVGIRVIYLTADHPAFIFYMCGILLIQWFLRFSVLIYSEFTEFSLNKYLFPGLSKST